MSMINELMGVGRRVYIVKYFRNLFQYFAEG